MKDCKFDTYWKRRHYFRRIISHWLMRRHTPLLNSYTIERQFLKLIFWIEPENCTCKHNGKFCFHCAEGRH